MANEENLRRLSPKEARRNGKKGGIASAKSRREKRRLRDRLELLLSLPADGDFEGDNGDAMCAALVKRAIGGDVGAFTAIRDSIGEKPTDKSESQISGGLAFQWQKD